MKRLFLSTVIFISCFGYSQVVQQDSLALVALYNSTNGSNWYHADYWLEDVLPVEYWFGIEVRNNRVVKIKLDYNNLQGSIPAEIADLDSLSQLILSQNQVNYIPDEMGNLTTLDTLAVNGNPLTALPSGIGNLSSLKYLNINSTQISILPEEMGGMTGLEYLLGSDALITNIPESIGNMTSLKEIDLSLNAIQSLPPSIGNLINLTRLQLNVNNLTEIPTEVQFLDNLEMLILGGNQINNIPNEVYGLSGLKFLNFAVNGIDSISPLIGNLTNLENFQFFNNNITFIPGEITNCSNLTYLNGYGNNIDSLPPNLLQIPLSTLALMYNSLTFEDIEPIFYLPGFLYYGQDSIGKSIDTTVVLNSAYTMEIATGGEHNEYQWFRGEEPIDGATESQYTISEITFEDAGIYHCEVTNTLATQLTLYTKAIHLSVTDINTAGEHNATDQIEIFLYPNPAKDRVTIDLDGNETGNRFLYEFYSSTGETVISVISSENGNTFSIRHLPEGVYYV
ncbi:MAG: T9SS type A sorting domain-containing protein, partial [Bacteroidales bacterium]|nr:T9SS type A sorting domain-containing protein [Bacteroidales bacterium]